MNAPRDLGPEFRAWLRDIPPMPPELPARTLAETRHTRQRRRWLWFLPGPKPTAGAEDERGDQIRPTVPTTTPGNGGTRTMFSATKLLGIAAAVALLGVMVISGPFATPVPQAPDAMTAHPGAITKYSGSMRLVEQVDAGTIDVLDWGSRIEGERWTANMEMDDPRVSGVNACNGNAFVTDRGAGWLRAMNCRLFNEKGTWRTTSHGYMAPKSGGIHYQEQLVGEGAYDGLFALQRCDMSAKTARFECEGAIYQGGFPATPDEPPAELPSG